MCLNAPKFGQDNDFADSHAERILNTGTAELDDASENERLHTPEGTPWSDTM